MIFSHGCLKAKVRSQQKLAQGTLRFFLSLPWFFKKLTLVGIETCDSKSFYLFIAILCAKISSVVIGPYYDFAFVPFFADIYAEDATTLKKKHIF